MENPFMGRASYVPPVAFSDSQGSNRRSRDSKGSRSASGSAGHYNSNSHGRQSSLDKFEARFLDNM